MTELFGRAARVQFGSKVVIVDPQAKDQGLDVHFAVTRSLAPEPNVAELEVYNLNADSRSALENLGRVPVIIEAGYGSEVARIFSGTARTIVTRREGVDLITTLSSGDGEKEYQQSRIAFTVSRTTQNVTLLKRLIDAMQIGRGNLGSLLPYLQSKRRVLSAGGVLSGSASQIMTRVCNSLGVEWSIQDGAAQLLVVRAPVAGTAALLTPSTGLIGSPSVDNEGVLSARVLMIPDVFPGRVVVLESERLAGRFRVEQCEYVGSTFSDEWSIDLEASKI